jgi:predicted PurR-regulated permease PerM
MPSFPVPTVRAPGSCLAPSRSTIRLPPGWPARLFGAAILAVLAYAALSALGRAAPVLALAFLASLLGSVLALAIRSLSPPLPRALATVVVLVAVLGIVGGVAWMALPRLVEQGRDLLSRLPAILDGALAALRQPFAGRGLAGEGPGTLAAELRTELTHRLTAVLGSAIPVARTAVTLVFGAFATLTIAAFLAYRPDVYIGGFLRLVPPRRREDFASFIARLTVLVQRWMLGALISMTFVAVATGLGLRALGIGPWFALATLAFFAEFVPYLGPLFSGVVAGTVALAQSPKQALWVALLFLGVQQLESNLVTPLVMKRVVRLQPALLLVWQFVLGALFGLPGVIVATPLLACVQLAVQHFYLEPRDGSPPGGNPGSGAGPRAGSSGVSGSAGASGESAGASGPRGSGGGSNRPAGLGGGGPAASIREATGTSTPDAS